jgi:hypothetical protein
MRYRCIKKGRTALPTDIAALRKRPAGIDPDRVVRQREARFEPIAVHVQELSPGFAPKRTTDLMGTALSAHPGAPLVKNEAKISSAIFPF